ncbi:chaperonin 10-like protein [Xylogone sp. PMI_703]|nr:chaperonin 10-like protein [Xylogone sp. PMI_703]
MSAGKVNVSYQGIDGQAKKLGPKQILIKITHTGLCGTDLHGIQFGVVLGHEGIGIVQAVGSEVTQFQIGDRAGGGFLRNSCGHCKYCLSGQDMWCYDRAIYIEADQQNGTLADYYVGVETYLHKIPDALSSEHAAPLQCAGATVYSAIVDNVKPGQRVGVVGIGGLGHLAIQFAAKLGNEVVVFSTTPDKEKEARKFGATEFYLTAEPNRISKPVDVLLISGSGYPDWEKFLNKEVLARQGIIVPLSAPSAMNLPGWPIFFDGYTIKSSLVATRKVHDDMLEFAARHSVHPQTETFELSDAGVKVALEKLAVGSMRYRGVLVAS